MTYPIADVSKKIPVMKAYAGMDGQNLPLFAESEHIDGIIIEALGAGNLGEYAARGVRVQLVSNGL